VNTARSPGSAWIASARETRARARPALTGVPVSATSAASASARDTGRTAPSPAIAIHPATMPGTVTEPAPARGTSVQAAAASATAAGAVPAATTAVVEPSGRRTRAMTSPPMAH